VDSVDGLSVSVWVQGCPHRCEGCHNSISWDYDGGIDVPKNLNELILHKLHNNGINRNLSILGGEPLCDENKGFVKDIIEFITKRSPETTIILWTGYVLEDLVSRNDDDINFILENIKYLIDGPFVKELRDTVNLNLRGSSNQRIFLNKPVSDVQRLLLKKRYRFVDVTSDMDNRLKVKFR
jgi:anaerobic ribonucleoside-triphosphate reductase activating protein